MRVHTCAKPQGRGRLDVHGGKAEVTVSIYEQLGEEVGIRTAVDEFYRRLLADPQVAHYFEGANMQRLRMHQTQLLSQVTGGPIQYEGSDLATAHARLAITGEDFDRVVEHLAGTLADLGVEQATIGQIGEALVAHRDEIVTAPASVR
jgi:hemoglobin